MKKERVGYVQIIIASVLFGLGPIFVKFGSNLGAYNLAFFSVFFAMLSLGVFLLFRKSIVLPVYEKGKLLLFGAIHGYIILGYQFAIIHLSISSAVLLLYSAPIWMIIFSNFILKERITKKTLFALIVSLIGVVIILSPTDLFVGNNFLSVIAALLGGIGFGLNYVLSKTFKKYDKVSLTFWQNAIALPFLLPILFMNSLPVFSLNNIGILILMGSCFSALPFVFVYKGFEKVKAQIGGIIVLLDIIFPIFFAFLIFNEIPSLISIFGGLLIIIGAYLASSQ